MSVAPTVSACLWFEQDAQEAVEFYVSLFERSAIKSVTRTPDGAVLLIHFELDGTPFTALNGGPHDRFNDAVSLVARCDGQDRVDQLWTALGEGGREKQCGWLQDRYGLSWQIVPSRLEEMLQRGDGERAGRVMAALMSMTKLDLAALEAAYGPSASGRE